jgi:four helix bundle protein
VSSSRWWTKLRYWISRSFDSLENWPFARGASLAGKACMKGIWKFEDLVAWQLAVRLQRITDGYCAKPEIRRDFRFRDQLTDAAASAPRNLAEGFGRFHHPEFARFARIAKASEEEVFNHLLDAKRKCYITLVECDDAQHAARRALKAVNGLIRYLDATPGFGKK